VPATKETRTITIPEVKFQALTVRIKGQTPLIVHRFGELAQKGITDKQGGAPKVKKGARKPLEEFRDSLYPINVERDLYGFPAGGIKKSLVSAGGRYAEEQQVVLRGAVNIPAELLLIEGSLPVMRQDTVRLAGIGRPASVAYRPAFSPWEIAVPVVFNTGIIQEGQVINLFALAGFGVGIGDWRVEKNGTYGMFEVAAVEEGIHLPDLATYVHDIKKEEVA
jgi:hypothetical protein